MVGVAVHILACQACNHAVLTAPLMFALPGYLLPDAQSEADAAGLGQRADVLECLQVLLLLRSGQAAGFDLRMLRDIHMKGIEGRQIGCLMGKYQIESIPAAGSQ